MLTVMENRLVDQAKQLLILREHITENEAHRLIQKRAMNLRITKTECASEIIKRYN